MLLDFGKDRNMEEIVQVNFCEEKSVVGHSFL